MTPKSHIQPIDKTIQSESGLSLHLRPEWQKVNFGKKFWSDFSLLGDNILISRPSGYATLPDVQQSLDLNHEVIRQGIRKGAPYVQIEDYSAFTGSSINARKYFINERSRRDNLLAIIFCSASPLMKLSIKLGMGIYSFKFKIHLAKDLREAVVLAQKILSGKNLQKQNFSIIQPTDDPSNIISNDEWFLKLDGFAIRFEVIDGDILHRIPSGRAKKEHIGPVFELQKKVFDTMRPPNGKYYLVSNQKDLKHATIKARRLLAKTLEKWHHTNPFEMIIFYSTNWILRAAINIGKTTVSYDVRIADDLASAMEIVKWQKDHPRQPKSVNAVDQSTHKDQHQKYAEEVINILAGINWEEQTPETIAKKVDPSHPLHQVAEAVSLIKMDIDQLLRERDISEKALLESREKYKNILDNMEEGYYEVDLSGNVTFSNPSLCSILEYSETELMGMNFREFTDKENIDTIHQTFNQVFRTGQTIDVFNWKLIRKDGTERVIETSISSIIDIDDAKKTTGFHGIVRDITQRIALEHEKEKLKNRLHHAQKMEAIGTLAGGVAHDLNNILSGLVSYPDLLLMKIPEESPLRKPIETIKKSGERAAAVVQDLLTLARKGLPNRDTTSLNTIISDYIKSTDHQDLLKSHPNVTVSSRLDENLLNMSASDVHITKIIMNLVINAAEAMPEGGIITIATENLYIDAHMSGSNNINEGEYVRLQIIDEGTGISPEEKERIFEPFYTKKTMGRSGSGLGLAIVWGAVHDHNGYIDIHSLPGQGTTISIFFPAVRLELSPKKTVSIDKFMGNGESVLVVDDIEEQRELAVQMLIQLGYKADSVSSGEEAIEHIQKSPVDLLILDMIMEPGMDGLDTYKKIIGIRPSQKAIIATGFSTSDRISQVQSLGAGACLKKPYLLEELARLVREELDR